MNVFPLKLPEGWKFSKVKITVTDIANSLLNLTETMFSDVGLAPPCLFSVFANFKSWALSLDPSGDRVKSSYPVVCKLMN